MHAQCIHVLQELKVRRTVWWYGGMDEKSRKYATSAPAPSSEPEPELEPESELGVLV